MQTEYTDLDAPLPSGTWTFYFHAPREKRWTLDTFYPIAKVGTLRETLAIFQELGDKLKRGMFFCMRNPIPPLWENYQNIRGGSYSIRGGIDEGVEYYKTYILAAMLKKAGVSSSDNITGISISPKIMSGPGGSNRVGFYVIKIWNSDSEAFNKSSGIHILHQKLVPSDILYTPHVDKKM
jgi:hypothetical protein